MPGLHDRHIDPEDGYLGAATDDALARRALDLSLTDEAPVTVRPNIVEVVSGFHPEMAFDFVTSHLDAFNAILEPTARDRYPVGLASNSFDPAMIDKIKAYAEAHIPPTARGDAVKAQSTIAYYAKIRSRYLPGINQWLSARH